MPDIVLPADVTQRATGSHWSTRLQQVTGRIGLRGARGALVAFGDYNADNFVDLFLVEDVLEENNASASVRELQAWTWRGDAQTGHFALSKANKWKMPGLVGMIPGDFNGDGELDAIVMTEHGRCAEHGAVQMLLCNHTFACAADPTGTALDVPAAAQPLALDFDGDMQADLLAAYRPFDRSGASGDACSVPAGGMCTRNMSLCCDCALECSFGPVSAGGGVGGWLKKQKAVDEGVCVPSDRSELRVWLNQWHGPQGFELLAPFPDNATEPARASPDGTPWPWHWPWQAEAPPASPPPPSPLPPPWLRLAVPNSNANADLNGDCRADLLVVTLPSDAPAEATCASVACELLIWLQQVDLKSSRGAEATPAEDPDAPPSSAARHATGVAADAPSAPPPKGTSKASLPPPPPRWLTAPSLNDSLPLGASQLSVTDMDADGLLDLIFVAPPQSSDGNATVHIWYAMMLTPQQAAMMANETARDACAPPPRPIKANGLCVATPFASLSFYKRTLELPPGWQVDDGEEAKREAEAAGLPHRPPTLSVADFFLDGFPDVLLPLRAPTDWQSGGETGCQPGGRCPALLHNDDGLRCEETNILTLFDANAGYSGSVASDGDSTVQDTDRGTRLQKKGRYLQESHDARPTADEQPAEFGARGGVGEELPSPRVFPLHGLAGVSTSVFFDLFEDGIWDVLAQYPNGTLTAWRQPPGGLDNYFLKVVTADGACAPAPMDGKLVMSNLPKFGGAPPPPDRRANHGASDTDYADDVDETDESSDDHDDTVLLSSGAMVHGSDGGVGGGDVPPPEDEDADAPSVRAHDAPPPPPITPASPGTRCVDKRAGAQGYMAGVNQPGVSYQFLTTLPTRWELVDASEAWQWNRPKQQRAGTQLCQSGYSPLLTPYVLAGLGTTNDYVEELMVGLPSGQVRGFAQAIIPNSRLVVIPFPYNQTDQWELRLYLEPRQQLYVGLVLVCALVIVGAVILLLELRERMQDAREKRALAPALPL